MLGAQRLHEVEPVRVAERDVDHGDVGPVGAEQLEGLGRGPGDAGEDHVGLGADGERDRVAHRRVVVHDSDPDRLRRARGGQRRHPGRADGRPAECTETARCGRDGARA